MPRRAIQGVGLCAILFIWLLPAPTAFAHHHTTVPVRILNTDGTERSRFDVSLKNWAGGLTVAVEDLGSDGVPEIIIGNGIGNEPRVRVLREDGSEIGSFLAYEPNMGVGINLAVCDLTGDDVNEIATAPGKGGASHVRLFSNMGEALHPGFFAYAEGYREGVSLACGDLDGDNVAELVTLPAAGGGPHVRIWKFVDDTFKLEQEFFAFDESDRRGLVGVVHDGQLYIGSSQHLPTSAHAYKLGSPAELIHTLEWQDAGTALGVTGMFERDGVIVLTIEGSQHIVELTSEHHLTTTIDTVSSRADAGDFDGDGVDEMVVVDGKPAYLETESEQNIIVDLSDQQLYAYEKGVLAHTFPVSAARWPWQTPIGIHSVLAKIPEVHYAWFYGSGNAENYDLGWVPYNLKFYPHIYIHYAPWHNNFGHTMSHGCVNVALDHMKWVYAWANVGTPVEVRE
jgi:hypothetical protein